MKRVVAIGELLIDFVPQEKGCPLREVSHFERVAGGAPANVVTAVSRLISCSGTNYRGDVREYRYCTFLLSGFGGLACEKST